jgi:hypothetical protein
MVKTSNVKHQTPNFRLLKKTVLFTIHPQTYFCHMSTWKIKRSRKAGQIPNVNQFPDSQTAIWNQRDGKLWGLQVDDGATRHVVLIGGGINTITDAHDRLHDLDSVLDHAPATGDKKGKWLRSHATTGAPTLAPIVHISEIEPSAGEFIEGDFWYDEDEEASFPNILNHQPADALNFGDLVRANPDDGNIEFFTLIGYGTKATGTDPGVLKELSYDSNWLYLCTSPGEAGIAIWKKFPLLNTSNETP